MMETKSVTPIKIINAVRANCAYDKKSRKSMIAGVKTMEEPLMPLALGYYLLRNILIMNSDQICAELSISHSLERSILKEINQPSDTQRWETKIRLIMNYLILNK